nr:penicillin binding protein transpeptidase domain protein [uncultured bacterium]AIA10649.1 penicillin binding protein transpeptidase domain protein [uncultured bacterium]
MFTSNRKPRAARWAGGIIGTTAVTLTIALAYGAEQSMRKDEIQPVNPGTAVVDPAIQKIAEAALGEAIKTHKAKGGFAIVAEPSSGKILAVANIDTTNKMSGRWALSQLLEPASIAKTLVVAQAIESGLTTPQEKHSCENGNYRYGSRVYHDWKPEGWNQLTTEETIAHSGTICTIKIAEKVSGDGLVKMLKDFGFGPEGTAKNFPEARTGVLPPLGNPYYPDVVPAVSAGFGFKITPIELVQAYGAIANGGSLMNPLPANADSSEIQAIRRVLSSQNAAKVKDILRQVVLKGTGQGTASSNLYSTAGKTASSHIPDLAKADGKKIGNFAGFIGFAPVNEPKVEVYVGIFAPGAGATPAHGSSHAAPVFKRIAEDVLKHWKVAPDQPQS